MCPVCLATTLTAILAGTTTAGGLAALAVKRCRARRRTHRAPDSGEK